MKPYRRPQSTDDTRHYVKKEDLLDAIREAKALGTLTNRLGKLLLLITQRYSRSPSFVSYSYRDDMVATAMVHLAKIWWKYDESRGTSPVAFYTTTIYRSFLQYLATEKEQRNIRDELLVESGHAPSWNYSSSKSGTSHDETAFS